MKVSVTDKGVFVNGIKLDRVTRVDVVNLNPQDDAEVVIHIAASEIEIDHKHLGVRE